MTFYVYISFETPVKKAKAIPPTQLHLRREGTKGGRTSYSNGNELVLSEGMRYSSLSRSNIESCGARGRSIARVCYRDRSFRKENRERVVDGDEAVGRVNG